MAKKIKLTSGDDNFSGGSKAEKIIGKAGDDNISGGGGNDIIWGGEGNDVIRGGAGDDTIAGGAGNNRILGGAGDDTITSVGNDTINGGEGDDLVKIAGNFADATVEMDGAFYVITSGTQTVRVRNVELFMFDDGTVGTAELDDVVSGSTGETTVLTTTDGETVVGTSENDTIIGVIGTGATFNTFDTVSGGSGDDTLKLSAVSATALPGVSQISEIEHIVVASSTAVLAAADISVYADVQDITSDGLGITAITLGAGQTATLANDAVAGTTLTFAATETSTTVTLDNIVSGDAVNLSGAALTTATVNGSVAGAGAITINDAVGGVLTTLNVGLTSDGTVSVTGASALTTFNASASTGDVTFTAAALGTVTTILGGSGADVLTESAAGIAVTGGAGQDDIVLDGTVASVVTVNAGDSGITAATVDTVAGFVAGTDDLDFNMTAGSATNFLNGGNSSSFVDALTNANTSFANDSALDYFVSDAGGNTFVFVDTNDDHIADMAVQLNGVVVVTAADIIA